LIVSRSGVSCVTLPVQGHHHATQPAKPAVRAKRSRGRKCRREFEEIQEQAEATREAADVKGRGAARLRDAEVRQSVEGVTVEGVCSAFGLGLEVSKALSE